MTTIVSISSRPRSSTDDEEPSGAHFPAGHPYAFFTLDFCERFAHCCSLTGAPVKKEKTSTMKAFVGFFLIALAVFGIHHAFGSPQTVEAATNNLAHTEATLKDATVDSRAQATQLTNGLTGTDRQAALPQELQEFNRSTERLITLRDQLQTDINEYKTAYNAKIAEFDQENASITDATTQRGMTTLRRRTEQDMTERIDAARSTMDQLGTVLAKGSDLQHAAKCVLIADELHAHGEDLDNQIQMAKQAATQYATTTNGLLARISQALAE